MKKLIHAVGTAIKVCILGAVVFMGTTLALEAIFGGKNDDSKVDVVQTVEAEEPVKETNTATAPKDPSDEEKESMTKSILMLWAEGYKEDIGDKGDVTYSVDGNTLTLNVAVDGTTLIASKAKEGDAEYKEGWNAIAQKLCENTSYWKKDFEETGYDINVVYNVLNDINRDNVLMIVCNGSVFYDYVEE